MIQDQRMRRLRMPSGLLGRLVVSFLLAIVCFCGSTVYTEAISRDIDAAALSIARNAMPSIEELSNARAELRRLDLAVTRYAAGHDAVDRLDALATRARIDVAFEHYLSLPIYTGEHTLQSSLRHALALVDRAVDAVPANQRVPPGEVSTVIRGASDAMRDAGDPNAEQARRLAERIEADHHRVTRAALILDILSTLFTALAAWLTVRAVAHHNRVVDERNRL